MANIFNSIIAQTANKLIHLKINEIDNYLKEIIAENKENIFSCDDKGNNLLHYVASQPLSKELAEKIFKVIEEKLPQNIKLPELINSHNLKGTTPMQIASGFSSGDFAMLLYGKGGDLLAQNCNKENAIEVAIIRDNVEFITELCENINDSIKSLLQQRFAGKTLLHLALINDAANCFKKLLYHNAKIDLLNKVDFAKNNCVMLAAEKGDVEALNILISNNAELNKVNGYNKSALQIAFDNNHLDIVSILLQNKCECDENLASAIGYQGAENIVKIITENLIDNDGTFVGLIPNSEEHMKLKNILEQALKQLQFGGNNANNPIENSIETLFSNLLKIRVNSPHTARDPAEIKKLLTPVLTDFIGSINYV